jgi:hypothetical protein
MRYAPDRAHGQFELAASVNACPMCLGDLVRQTDISGFSYVCVQCQTTIPAPRRTFQNLRPAIITSLTRHAPPVQAA